MFMFLTLLGGLTFLALGANALLRGTVGLAHIVGLPQFLIGLMIVAFGSSTPQLFTAVQATISETPILALGAVVGASIFNIFVTLGVVALSGGAVHLNFRVWIRGSLALALIATGMAGALYFFAHNVQPIPKWLGFLSIAGLAAYVAAAYAYDHKNPINLPLLKEARKLPPVAHIALFIAGLLGLILGANLLVDVAKQLTLTRGFNAPFLGLSVLAVGTALPQLIASFVAYQDKQHSLLMNNLIGNTIFNILGICGLLFATSSILLVKNGMILTSFMVLAVATVFFLIFTHPSMRRFKRAEAILFILAYTTYIGYLIHSL
ncbi:MAG: hypothetical protein DI585_04240 [Pseudomonas fluorescens]|nr:MAG: hypothetical protein DI585_04240 [Pseudomonas fluorescens]